MNELAHAPVNTNTLTDELGCQRRLHHFLLLPHLEQRAAIQRLAVSGWGDYTIAAATGLSVEMIRQILGERAST